MSCPQIPWYDLFHHLIKNLYCHLDWNQNLNFLEDIAGEMLEKLMLSLELNWLWPIDKIVL